MNHKVSFGAISTDASIKLQDSTINQAPSYSTIAQASKNIKGDSFEKKESGGKKFAKFLGVLTVLAAASATILGVMFHKGNLGSKTIKELSNETGKEIEKSIRKADEELNILEKVGKWADELFSSVKKRFAQKAPEAPETPKVEPNIEPKVEPKIEPKVEVNAESKVEPKVEVPDEEKPSLIKRALEFFGIGKK